MRRLALILVLASACNAAHVGDLAPPQQERLLELAAPAFTGASIAWNPVRATPATPAEMNMAAMGMALPLHVGDRLTSLGVTCAAVGFAGQIKVSIYRTSAQGADVSVTTETIGVTPAWGTFFIQDPDPLSLEKDETLSLRVSTSTPVSCGNVSVRYEAGAP